MAAPSYTERRREFALQIGPGAAQEAGAPTAEEADDRILARRGRTVISEGHQAPTRTHCVGRPRLWIWVPAALSAP